MLQEALLVAADAALDRGEVAAANAIMDAAERSIGTGRLDGALGQEYRAIQATLDRSARAVRLGDRAMFRAATVKYGLAWPAARFTDYRWTISAIAVSGADAEVTATRRSADAAGITASAVFQLRLRRVGGAWRIVEQRSAPPLLRLPPRLDDLVAE